MNAEFKIGDKVTFKPYEKAIPSVIGGIEKGGAFNGSLFKDDDRIFYNLTADNSANKRAALVTRCTGISIVESVLFDPWTPEKAKLFFKT